MKISCFMIDNHYLTIISAAALKYDLLSIERKKELVDMFRTQELPVTAVHNLTHIPNRAFECAKVSAVTI